MKYLALLLVLGGCTATNIEVATSEGSRYNVSSYRLFNQTGFSLTPDGAFSYSSDPQSQQAVDLLKAGMTLGLQAR